MREILKGLSKENSKNKNFIEEINKSALVRDRLHEMKEIMNRIYTKADEFLNSFPYMPTIPRL